MASLHEIPREKLNGIGEKRARLFNKLGIVSVADLVRFYPRSYEDWSKVTKISEAEQDTPCCIKARVDSPLVPRRVSGGLLLTTARASDESGFIKLVFFNNKYIDSMLKQGTEYLFYGKLTESSGMLEMVSPTFQRLGTAIPIRPIYRQVSGLTTKQIEAAVKQVINMIPPTVKDPLPEEVR